MDDLIVLAVNYLRRRTLDLAKLKIEAECKDRIKEKKCLCLSHISRFFEKVSPEKQFNSMLGKVTKIFSPVDSL